MTEKLKAAGWVLLGLAALLYAYTGWTKQTALQREAVMERINLQVEKQARGDCVPEAEIAAVRLAKTNRALLKYSTLHEGEYLVEDYEISYERCLHQHGFAK